MDARPRQANGATVAGRVLLLAAVAAVAWPSLRSAGAASIELPLHLSETGLYDAGGAIDPRNRPFFPQYPLWSDGAEKSRWIRLPEGSRIDVSDVDAWRFPPGTTIWKEFAWGGRRVETRMMVARPGGDWAFASYVWTEDQTDARLAPAEGVPAAYEFAPGRRHSIPAVADCATCHASSPAIVLGFNALQLSDDRDPLAPHAEPLTHDALTLRTLVDEDLLDPPRPEFVRSPPRIRESDPVARAALGYLSSNCGVCHNDRGPLARLGFALAHDAGGDGLLPEPATTAIGNRGRYLVPGVTPEASRIVAPGEPEHSALLHRMKSRRPASQMPPLGTVVPDAEAIDLVERWILALVAPED